MKSTNTNIKTNSTASGLGAIKSATRSVTGNERNSVHTMSSLNETTESKNDVNKSSTNKNSDNGDYSQDRQANFAARLASNGRDMAYIRGANFGKNGISPGAFASSSSSSLGATPLVALSDTSNSSWNGVAAAADDVQPITPHGKGHKGGVGNFQDVPTDPGITDIDPSQIKGYKETYARLEKAISIQETNGSVSMGAGLGIAKDNSARQEYKDHVLNVLTLMTSRNPNLLEKIEKNGLDVYFANGGIHGSAADGRSGVAAYMQTGDGDGIPNMVLGSGRDATTIFHEMTHYFDGTDGNGMNGVLPVEGFAGTISDAANKMRSDLGRLNSLGFSRISYGLSNNQEVLAVLSENYHKRNDLFRQEFPEMAKKFDAYFGTLDGNFRRETPEENPKTANEGTRENGNRNNASSESQNEAKKTANKSDTTQEWKQQQGVEAQ